MFGIPTAQVEKLHTRHLNTWDEPKWDIAQAAGQSLIGLGGLASHPSSVTFRRLIRTRFPQQLETLPQSRK